MLEYLQAADPGTDGSCSLPVGIGGPVQTSVGSSQICEQEDRHDRTESFIGPRSDKTGEGRGDPILRQIGFYGAEKLRLDKIQSSMVTFWYWQRFLYGMDEHRMDRAGCGDLCLQLDDPTVRGVALDLALELGLRTMPEVLRGA